MEFVKPFGYCCEAQIEKEITLEINFCKVTGFDIFANLRYLTRDI